MDLNWIAIGAGSLALSPRPGFRAPAALAAAGCEIVVSLLSASEGAEEIGRHIQDAGLTWLWLPMRSGKPPGRKESARIRAFLSRISAQLDEGKAVLIHCAAGMHRTGMITYALLRWRGLSPGDAFNHVSCLRAHTANALRAEHFSWADRLIMEGIPVPPAIPES